MGDEAGRQDYSYRRGEWSPLKLQWPEGRDSVPTVELHRFWGYDEAPDFKLGSTMGSFLVTVYSSRSAEAGAAFLVDVSTPGSSYYIQCPELPDLVQLLGELTPIVRASHQAGMETERCEHLEDHRRKADPECWYCREEQLRR